MAIANRSNIPAPATALRIDGIPIAEDGGFGAFNDAVGAYARDNRGFSIDDVVSHLDDGYGFGSDAADSSPGLGCKRLLVFAVLGWQSMVYQPAFNIFPPSELAIFRDANEADSGLFLLTTTRFSET